MSGSRQLGVGTHRFPFFFQIPDSAPCSFEGMLNADVDNTSRPALNFKIKSTFDVWKDQYKDKVNKIFKYFIEVLRSAVSLWPLHTLPELPVACLSFEDGGIPLGSQRRNR